MQSKFVLTALFLVLTLAGGAQSYHFSQLYSTPLLINPAFTGYMQGPYRLGANFRSQWVQGNSPYITASVSADFNLLTNKIREGNNLGAGIVLTNDQSSDGALQVNSVALSAAYNLSLDADNIQSLGLGLQGSFNQRRIDLSKLSFESQFGSGGFDPNLPIGEAINASAKSYFDANAGIDYHYTEEDKAFFASVAIYNVLQHKDNILPDEFRMPFRYSLLGAGQLDLGYGGTIRFSVNHLYQAGAHETTVGGSYGIQIESGKTQEVSLGMWYRMNDAVIPYVGYQVNNFQTGFSYDYTVSTLKTASVAKNGFELSILYTGKDNRALKKAIPWY